MTKITIDVIDNQRDFIVINKPHNINFHDEEVVGSGLFSQVKHQLKIPTLFPVHRLDKMTSGLLIFAKNLPAAQIFQQQFEQHHIEKYYLALAHGKPKKKQGLIKGDMEKSRRGMWKLLRSQNSPAITQFMSTTVAPKLRLYLVKPHSGKTHQIRVALNSLGTPISGDPLYNQSSVMDRGYLHAFALRFKFQNKTFQYLNIPTQGEYFTTQEVQQAIASFNPPFEQNWPTI